MHRSQKADILGSNPSAGTIFTLRYTDTVCVKGVRPRLSGAVEPSPLLHQVTEKIVVHEVVVDVVLETAPRHAAVSATKALTLRHDRDGICDRRQIFLDQEELLTEEVFIEAKLGLKATELGCELRYLRRELCHLRRELLNLGGRPRRQNDRINSRKLDELRVMRR